VFGCRFSILTEGSLLGKDASRETAANAIEAACQPDNEKRVPASARRTDTGAFTRVIVVGRSLSRVFSMMTRS
jgi:hypothetical protein